LKEKEPEKALARAYQLGVLKGYTRLYMQMTG
jgi:hypothetical protein